MARTSSSAQATLRCATHDDQRVGVTSCGASTRMALRSRLALAMAIVVAAAAMRADARGPGYDYEVKKFTVKGTVLCQDCTKNWNAYAYNARPIPGSVVGVTCLDKRTGRTVYHGRDATDDKGVFNIEVPAEVRGGCRLEPTDCLVRIASSGDAGCAVLTNFNGGRTGEKPYRPVKIFPGEVTYAVGPYYATLPKCDVKGDGGDCAAEE
ncbi:hypothetical protein QOZ80_2AG0115620 [Eleusine coracana subsp. coracana]|nr:hypothetical protein QOZ80_2AG0115620 [Eleusine coracana subsp. coracana]